jgi:gluconate 2-dehydrogenase gamma chain
LIHLTPWPVGGFFDATEIAQVRVLFDCIMPSTPTAPGAVDAGAAEFLDYLLAPGGTDFHEVELWRRAYKTGLPALDVAARRGFGAGLADLSRSNATELLALLANGELADWPGEPGQQHFFDIARAHCLHGCFSDPRWGGNHDSIFWRWLGYGQPAEDLVRSASGALTAADRDGDR